MVLAVGTAIKEFFAWLSKRNLLNSENRIVSMETSIKDVKNMLKEPLEQITELHEWHNKSDQDGVKIWYVRKSLEDTLKESSVAISAIARNIELQTRLHSDYLEYQKDILAEIRKKNS